MDYSLVVSAFIAGVITFLAPCTLPLVPGYLGFISGVSLGDLGQVEKARGARRKIFFDGLLFIAGFSAVFIALGTLAGFAGASLVPYRLWLGRIGGVFVVAFGLFMLGILRLPALSRDFRWNPPAWIPSRSPRFPLSPAGDGKSEIRRAEYISALSFFEPGRPVNSLIFGSAFAFGWTPCVGPILGSILLLASTSATALQGAFLLAVFSAGLAVPFLAIAYGIGSAGAIINRLAPLLHAVSIMGGVFLVILGTLLITDSMPIFISYGYRVFRFIEYERLLDSL